MTGLRHGAMVPAVLGCVQVLRCAPPLPLGAFGDLDPACARRSDRR